MTDDSTPADPPADSPEDDGDGPLIEHDPTIVYRPVGPAAATEQARQQIAGAFRYAVVVERGPRAGLAFVLGAGTTTAGRSEDADIFLGDVTVSRDHVRFIADHTGLRIEDLGSTNGTYVNGERADSAQLEPGDEIIIGKFHLVVIVGDA